MQLALLRASKLLLGFDVGGVAFGVVCLAACRCCPQKLKKNSAGGKGIGWGSVPFKITRPVSFCAHSCDGESVSVACACLMSLPSHRWTGSYVRKRQNTPQLP